jgi:thiol-disulfide isomerase/thioredoxin
MNVLRRAAPLLVAAALGLGGIMAWQQTKSESRAPDVAYTLLDGSQSTIGALRGKVVLINFWATSCTTCVARCRHRRHPREIQGARLRDAGSRDEL